MKAARFSSKPLVLSTFYLFTVQKMEQKKLMLDLLKNADKIQIVLLDEDDCAHCCEVKSINENGNGIDIWVNQEGLSIEEEDV